MIDGCQDYWHEPASYATGGLVTGASGPTDDRPLVQLSGCLGFGYELPDCAHGRVGWCPSCYRDGDYDTH